MRRLLTLTVAALLLMAQVRPSIINRQLLIVLDGLRPDYVRADIMPNLFALGQQGVVFQNHHAVYPTVTRVNASSIATGTYPAAHGLMGNSVFFPAVDPNRFLDTSDRANLVKINDTEKGRLQTTTTLAEILQRAGRKMLVVSSGSSGSAFLLNYHVAGGAILHNEFALPEALGAEMTAKLGANPPETTPNAAQNRRAVDGFLQIGLPRIDPSVTVMWISDPDTTAHQHGIGHPTTIDALKRIDGEVKRVLDGLAAAGQLRSLQRVGHVRPWLLDRVARPQHRRAAQAFCRHDARRIATNRLWRWRDLRPRSQSRCHCRHRDRVTENERRRRHFHAGRVAGKHGRTAAGYDVVRRDPLEPRAVRGHSLLAGLDRSEEPVRISRRHAGRRHGWPRQHERLGRAQRAHRRRTRPQAEDDRLHAERQR